MVSPSLVTTSKVPDFFATLEYPSYFESMAFMTSLLVFCANKGQERKDSNKRRLLIEVPHSLNNLLTFFFHLSELADASLHGNAKSRH